MLHSWQWQNRLTILPKLYRSGSKTHVRRSTGSTSGSYKDGGRCISTIACTLLIPVQGRRYYLSGSKNGKLSFRKCSPGRVPICGYERTGHITREGIAFYKHTHRRYTNLSRLISQATVEVLKINIQWTKIVLTSPLGGGGAQEPLQIY